MSTISHNLANVSTNGFKRSKTEFADVIASSVSISPTQMVGSGTVVKAVRQQFGQGGVHPVDLGARLAISGEGFFAVKPDPSSAKVVVHPQRRLLGRCRSLRDRRQRRPPAGLSGRRFGHGRRDRARFDGQPAPAADQRHARGDRECRAGGQPVGERDDAQGNAVFNTATNPYAFDRFNPATYNNSSQTTVYDAGRQRADDDQLFRPRHRRRRARARPATGRSTPSSAISS